jgi:hypothetical protein
MSRARGTPILVRGNSGHGHGPCRGSWLALFSDGRRASDAHLEDLRDPAAITIDVRFLPSAEARDQVTWINRSGESTSIHRLHWVVGDTEELEAIAPAGVDPIAAVRRIHSVDVRCVHRSRTALPSRVTMAGRGVAGRAPRPGWDVALPVEHRVAGKWDPRGRGADVCT